MRRRKKRAAEPLFEIKHLTIPSTLPGFPHIQPGVITRAQFIAVVQPILESFLAPLGFEPVKPLFWVRSTRAPLREIFELSQGKATDYFPDWGFSLDFVPHLENCAMRWHDSPQKARLDLSGATPWRWRDRDRVTVTSFWGVDGARAQALANLPRSIALARAAWDSVRREGDLLDLFEVRLRSHMRKDAMDLPFSVLTQHSIAYAFVLARAGRKRAAARWFRHYLERQKWPKATPERLLLAFEEAQSGARRVQRAKVSRVRSRPSKSTESGLKR